MVLVKWSRVQQKKLFREKNRRRSYAHIPLCISHLPNKKQMKAPILYRTDIPGRMIVAYNDGKDLFLFSPDNDLWVEIELPAEVARVDAACLVDCKLYVAYRNRLWLLADDDKAFHIDRFHLNIEEIG